MSIATHPAGLVGLDGQSCSLRSRLHSMASQAISADEWLGQAGAASLPLSSTARPMLSARRHLVPGGKASRGNPGPNRCAGADDNFDVTTLSLKDLDDSDRNRRRGANDRQDFRWRCRLENIDRRILAQVYQVKISPGHRRLPRGPQRAGADAEVARMRSAQRP